MRGATLIYAYIKVLIPSQRSHSTGHFLFLRLLGHGDSNSRNIPTLVKDISNVGEVSCGSSHTIALSKDGRTVWSFGGGDNGVSQLSFTSY